MDVRAFAQAIVLADHLEAKLEPAPSDLSDREPGPALRIGAPGRPERLKIVPAAQARVPPIEGMPDPAQRARILHGAANHELQAVELFAWALLAFPAAPADLRLGLLAILAEEQVHTRLYLHRLKAFGVRFGDYPVSGYFWNKVAQLTTVSRFLCAMSLTFENANLDHTTDYAAAARAVGDEETAALFDRVHTDEVGHVSFGWRWLTRLKDPELTTWEAYRANLSWPLRPALARGKSFHPEGREAAGLDPEAIRLFAKAGDD